MGWKVEWASASDVKGIQVVVHRKDFPDPGSAEGFCNKINDARRLLHYRGGHDAFVKGPRKG